MIPLEKNNFKLDPVDVANLLQKNYTSIMPAFYESQSSFLCDIYKRYKSIETANIILCFARKVHLEIIRQREKDLNFNVSMENFWKNLNYINKPSEKITNIVQITGIPKETVRRKIKNLLNLGFLEKEKNSKGFYWAVPSETKNELQLLISNEVKQLAGFITKLLNPLGIKLTSAAVEEEIKFQFSFYWYHYLTCQLAWLKFWQTKLKDNDLLIVALQATIPTLQFINKKTAHKINLEEIFKILGSYDQRILSNNLNHISISPTSVSDVTGIPRATCIRKLDKLVELGFLIRIERSKRYAVNQTTDERTKNILSKDNVNFTIRTFSKYFSIIANSLYYQNQLRKL